MPSPADIGPPDRPPRRHFPPLLLTRPADRAGAFLEALARHLPAQPEAIVAPLLEIRPLPLPDALRARLARYRGLILTSAQAAALLPDDPALPRAAHVVGAATARAARRAGRDVRTEALTAEELLARLVERGEPGPLLHLRGRETRLDFATALSGAGTPTDAAIVYDQLALSLSPRARQALATEPALVVPLFSPRTAELFAGEAAEAAAALHVVAMSPAVAEAVAALPVARLVVAEAPAGAEMVTRVAALYRDWLA